MIQVFLPKLDGQTSAIYQNEENWEKDQDEESSRYKIGYNKSFIHTYIVEYVSYSKYNTLMEDLDGK